MLYHFSSWSSRPMVIFLSYVMVKTWFLLCSLQCTQCRCMEWFALGLCFGLAFHTKSINLSIQIFFPKLKCAFLLLSSIYKICLMVLINKLKVSMPYP